MHDGNQQRIAQLNRREFYDARVTLSSPPQMYAVGLTQRCNLRCVMCWTRQLPPVDLSGRVMDAIQPYLARAYDINWHGGGEALASPQTARFLELAKACRPHISHFTSNFQLYQRWADDVLQAGFTDISLSIDATNAATYEGIRLGAKWDRLLSNLELFLEKRQRRGGEMPRLQFCFVVLKRNLGEMREFVRLAHRFRAASVLFLRLMPTTREFAELELPDEAEEVAGFYAAYALGQQLELPVIHNTYHAPTEAPTEAPADAPDNSSPAPVDASAPQSLLMQMCERENLLLPACDFPWLQMVIKADGQVSTCCGLEEIAGDLNWQSLEEIWNGPALRDLRHRLREHDYSRCRNCWRLAKPYHLRRDAVSDTVAFLETLPDAAAEVSVPAGTLDKTLAHLRKARLERGQLREDVALLLKLAEAQRQQLAELSPPDAAEFEAEDSRSYEERMRALQFSVRYLSHQTPGRLTCREEREVEVTLVNDSCSSWSTSGLVPIYLSYGWLDRDGRLLNRSARPTALPAEIPPFQPLTVKATLTAPETPGQYTLMWDLAICGKAWFSEKGASALYVPVTVDEC